MNPKGWHIRTAETVEIRAKISKRRHDLKYGVMKLGTREIAIDRMKAENDIAGVNVE